MAIDPSGEYIVGPSVAEGQTVQYQGVDSITRRYDVPMHTRLTLVILPWADLQTSSNGHASRVQSNAQTEATCGSKQGGECGEIRSLDARARGN